MIGGRFIANSRNNLGINRTRLVFKAVKYTQVTQRRMLSQRTPKSGEVNKNEEKEKEEEKGNEKEEHSHEHSHSMLSGHSHSHAHGNEMLTLSKSQILSNPGVRITWIGLIVNVTMAITKGLGGFYFHSQALLADAVHSVSDLISDFLTLGTVNVSSKEPSKRYPLGYGKIETIGSLGVSGLLLFAGISVGWSSLISILEFLLPHNIYEMVSTIQFGHSHSHSHSHSHAEHGVAEVEATDINAAWIALASIAIKEWLFKKTLKVAEETNSKVLVANAWHHRVDSLTSIVAVITISGGYFFNIGWLDAVGGLAVSSLIIRAGYGGLSTSLLELIDRAVPSSDSRYTAIEDIINEKLGGLISSNNSGKPYKISQLDVLPSGANLNVNLVLEAPVQKWNNVLTINEMSSVSNYLKNKLMEDDKYIKGVNISYIEETGEETDEETQSHGHSHSHHDHTH